MHDSRGVRLREGLARLGDPLGRDFDRKGPALDEHVSEVVTLEKLHDHVGDARLEGPDVEDASRVLAPQSDGGAGVAPETLDALLVAERLAANELDRDALIELLVLRGDDDAHAARTDLPLDPVLACYEISLAHRNETGFGRGHASPPTCQP